MHVWMQYNVSLLQRDKISAVKATIIRQDDHIKRLMKSITPHS